MLFQNTRQKWKHVKWYLTEKPLYSRYIVYCTITFLSADTSYLINLSFATFFWGTLQLTNGPFRIRYNMRGATFVTAIYVEMASHKKKIQFTKRPQASSREPMNGRSLGDRKKNPREKKILTGFFPWRAKSRSFATRRCSLWGCERACSLLFRQREPSFQNDYHLSLSLSLTLTFPLINDARKWRRRAASLGHREITRANSPLKRKKILVKP